MAYYEWAQEEARREDVYWLPARPLVNVGGNVEDPERVVLFSGILLSPFSLFLCFISLSLIILFTSLFVNFFNETFLNNFIEFFFFFFFYPCFFRFRFSFSFFVFVFRYCFSFFVYLFYFIYFIFAALYFIKIEKLTFYLQLY
jgi:hypothetical protein